MTERMWLFVPGKVIWFMKAALVRAESAFAPDDGLDEGGFHAATARQIYLTNGRTSRMVLARRVIKPAWAGEGGRPEYPNGLERHLKL
jgi:hypothetical protein